MKTIAIIQARMSSQRLPGKVLKKILGKSLLEHLALRLQGSKKLDALVLATSLDPSDDVVEKEARKCGLEVFRGSLEHVLERYYGAAQHFSADCIVRITGDCPLLDPQIVDGTLNYYQIHKEYDYVSTSGYPLGMSAEVFSFSMLKEAYQRARFSHEKEHVTPYFYRHPEKKFSIGRFRLDPPVNYRLTVDTGEDFLLVEKIFESLYPQNPKFSIKDIFRLLENHPEWLAINAHIPQKTLPQESNL